MNLPSEQEHAPQPPQTITAGEWIASKTAGSEQGRAGTGFALTSMSMPKTSTCLARAVCSSCFPPRDRKSTRLNSSHGYISYAVFCLKKKKRHDRNRRACNASIRELVYSHQCD